MEVNTSPFIAKVVELVCQVETALQEVQQKAGKVTAGTSQSEPAGHTGNEVQVVARRAVRVNAQRKDQAASTIFGDRRADKSQARCGNCGFYDHEAGNRVCPARGKECHFCEKTNRRCWRTS